MSSALLADALLVLHAGFVLFALFGALVVAWKPWTALLHVPAALWAVLVEVNGWICPLTPLEQRLRATAGEANYGGSFIEHFVQPLLYPRWLTPRVQLALAAVVIVVNAALYTWVWRRARSARAKARQRKIQGGANDQRASPNAGGES